MKASKRILILALIMIAFFSTAHAQNKEERRKQQEKAVKEALESGSYQIDVTMAYPHRSKSVSLSSAYSLQIKNDSVMSYLPFYGRAYSIPYGGGNGLIFKAPLEEYRMEAHKKGSIKVEFKTSTREDRFIFRLIIFSNGSADIDVNMQNRESIRFTGKVE